MALWDRIQSRGNVEDRRAMAPAIGGLGIAGVALYLVVSYFTNTPISVPDVLNQLQNVQVEQQQNGDTSKFKGEDTYEVFASKVLGSNNDMWQKVFSQSGKSYKAPKLVLFRTATQSGCGGATSDVGPHYCPLDNTIYLDETFFDELTNRLGAKGGDVAQAYVISHEAGHAAQNELGIMKQVNQSEDNQQSIKLELQADCFAGLWAHSVQEQGVLLPGEIEEAMDAAAAVGDDRIQKKVEGYVNPETWTHGSSQQRVSWFTKGFESGNLSNCDTFK
jgi:predicted metalloprotease